MSIELLKRFCSDQHDTREHLHAPMRLGDFDYATNGHILVRVPVVAGAEVAPAVEKMTGHLSTMFKCIDDAEPAWRAMPVLDEVKKCDCCHGARKLRIENCESCKGEGQFEHFGYDYSCQHCESNGWLEVSTGGKVVDCFMCHGRGHDTSQRMVLAQSSGPNPVPVNTGYLSWLAALPGVVVATQDNERALRFKFDGGHALLMPMRI
jgi:hypothetical protein